ncbi:MAG TPA: hypothetical protein PK122_05370 [Candidatus Paceibacterota bacterium]|nr:hypothetical protein [Candidatus Paceibacterota bacterium]
MMGKVIIDVQMLGMNFMQVIFREAMELATEKGLDPEKISKELAEAPTQEDFMEIIEKNFGDELIILF